MTAQLTSAIARISNSNGEVVGAGFLVAEKHILTCAHVVNAALGKPLTALEEPIGEVYLDFPQVAPGKKITARVVRWIPVPSGTSTSSEEGADIAALELNSTPPDNAQPVRLVTAEKLWGHRFRLFGFPAKHDNGVWTHGELRQPISGGRVQMEVVQGTAYRVESGFSGAPVWDEQLDGVAGMTVTAEKQRADVKAAFIIPATQLIEAWPTLGEKAIPPCPYRGLSAFQEEDAKFFFGRETFTKQLVASVSKKQLVAVIGASGSGKSSVVFAGLVPHLRSEQTWLIESFRPSDRPFCNVARRFVSLLETQMSENDRQLEINKQAKALRQGDLALRDVITRILEKNPGSRLLLIADQFEELYTLCQDVEERQEFLSQLLTAVKRIPNFKLVLTLRADFLGYALSHRPLADALQNADVKLGPMNLQELRDAIEKPAKLLGVQIEQGLTERILKAVEGKPGNLPLLEFALTLLWDKQKNGRLNHAAYEDIGGLESAIARHAQDVYENLEPTQQQIAKRIFLELTQLGEGTEDTRRQILKQDLLEMGSFTSVQKSKVLVEQVIQKLAAAKLVVTSELQQGSPGTAVVDVAHEALIRHWPTLRQWVEENRDLLRRKRAIEAAAQDWKNQGGLEELAYLLQGSKLTDAEDFLLLYEDRIPLSRLAQEFIFVSQVARDRLLKEEEERRQRELQQEREARIYAQRTTIAAIASLFVLVISGGFVWQQRQQTLQTIKDVSLDIDVGNQKLLSVLPDFLEEADRYKNRADRVKDVQKRIVEEEVVQALAYYRKIITETSKLQKEAQPQEKEKIDAIAKKAEKSLVELIQKHRLPQLEEELKKRQFGNLGDEGSLLAFEKQYTPGALQTTYRIVMREFGVKADLNDDGELQTPEEANRIPCETLKAIEELWRKYTQNRCSWYGQNSDLLATNTDCRELDGLTLTTKILIVPPFDAGMARLESCQIAVAPTNKAP